MWPIVLYDRAKTGKILWAVSSKRPPTSKNRHLIPYNSGLRKFLRKTIWLKPWAPFSFSIMQKLGRSLMRKGQKPQKRTLNPLYCRIKNFFSHLAQTMCIIVPYYHAKIVKILKSCFGEKLQSKKHLFGQLITNDQTSRFFQRSRLAQKMRLIILKNSVAENWVAWQLHWNRACYSRAKH